MEEEQAKVCEKWMEDSFRLDEEPQTVLLRTLEEIAKEYEDKPRYGGLIPPPVEGCIHSWEPHILYSWGPVVVGMYVSRCSKCFVIGDPPKSK